MQRQRIELEPAWVLHARPYSDTSLLVEVFSASHGRLGLIARGARAPKSRLKPLLQVLQPLLLSWRDAGELATLTAAEAAGAPLPLAGESLFCAWYANELLMKLLPRRDAHPVLFAAYARLLQRLAHDAASGLRAFERLLLDELGYGLVLPDALPPGGRYVFEPGLGLRPARASDDPRSHLLAESLAALRDDALGTPAQHRDALRLLRAALQPLLQGRVIESARLLRALRELEAEAGTIGAITPAPAP